MKTSPLYLCTFVDIHFYSGAMSDKVGLSVYFKLQYDLVPLRLLLTLILLTIEIFSMKCGQSYSSPDF